MTAAPVMPALREARVRVMADLGPLRLVHGAYLQDWLSTEDDDNWRVAVALSGRSRAFADIGSHWCDLVEFVTGDRLASVCAELLTAVPQRLARDAHAHAFESSGGGREAVAAPSPSRTSPSSCSARPRVSEAPS
jgi:predicted dehydrogenase